MTPSTSSVPTMACCSHAEEVLNEILVGKLAAEEWLFHLRGIEGAQGIREERRLRRSRSGQLAFWRRTAFSLSLLRPKNLVNDIGAHLRAAGLDLDLKRALVYRLARFTSMRKRDIGRAILLPGTQAGSQVARRDRGGRRVGGIERRIRGVSGKAMAARRKIMGQAGFIRGFATGAALAVDFSHARPSRASDENCATQDRDR